MQLRVRHITIYRYPGPVRENTNQVRLLPRLLPRQRLLREELRVEPEVTLFFSVDFWGNRVAHFSVLKSHDWLRIESLVEVETFPPPDLSGLEAHPATLQPGSSGPGATAPGDTEAVDQHDLRDFLLPTRLTAAPADLGDLGRTVAALRARHATLPGFLDNLAGLLKCTLRYEPGITTVESTVSEVLAKGGGVCQDFSHLFVALCRLQGIPARYAGGYHYLGAGAARHENHAWAEAYVPGAGWVGWDPANGVRVGEAHVQITAGRDFADVSPVRGSFRGPAPAELEIHLHMDEI